MKKILPCSSVVGLADERLTEGGAVRRSGRSVVRQQPLSHRAERWRFLAAGVGLARRGACLLAKKDFFAIPSSMSPERPGLDLSSVEALHKGIEAPPNKQADGEGRRFILGEENAAVAVDVYPTHPAFVRILTRTGKEAVFLDSVKSIAPDENGSIHITNADSECLVGKDGRISYLRTPPEIEMIPFQEATVGQRKGKYTQAVLETGQTKEGDRVEKYGSVAAAPRPANARKDSPLQFILLVDDPEKEGEKEKLEIHATRKARQQLQGYKLVRGDRIEAVLYRHTWEEETIGGDRLTHTRYNLAAVIKIERKDETATAKRTTKKRATNQE